MIKPFQFGVQSRPGKFGPDSGARIINGIVEQAPEEADVPYFVYARPGLKTFTGTLSGAGGFRGGISLGPVSYVVTGPVLRKIDSLGTDTIIGGVPGGSLVRMARNRKATPQIAIVSDGLRYILEEDAINQISDTDLPPPIDVTSIAGYFVFTIADGRYFITSINEGTEIDALDFAEAEALPDGLVAGRARGDEVVFYGENSIEFHANTGAADFPFQRVPQATIENLGCIAASTIQNVKGVHIFVASDATVRKMVGYNPEVISHPDVVRAIEALSDKSTLRSQSFSIADHHYYVLSAPSFTWACDLATGFWFEWETAGHSRWKAEGYLEIGGKKIVGDYENPILYELDPDTHDDAGDHLIWKLIGRLNAYPARVELNEFYANMIPGVGLNTTDAHLSDPQVMMRVSKDNGTTWGNQKQRSVGKIGEKSKSVRFGRFGTSKEDGFLCELSMSAAVSRGWTGSAVDIQTLPP